MRITFDPSADADLDDIFDWISQNNETAAYKMISRIRARVALLAIPGFEHMGRPGIDEGTRELVEYPYIIVYEVFESRSEIVVWTIVHGAQDREGRER